MLVLSANQPSYMIWYGMVKRIKMSNLHVILDDKQFSNNLYHHRNRIRSKDGWQWLTVPVIHRNRKLPINKVRISGSAWRQTHKDKIRLAYRDTPYFDKFWPDYETLLNQDWKLLADLSVATQNLILKHFKVRTEMVLGSDLKIEGRRGDYLLNLCKELGATKYLTTPEAMDYLPLNKFKQAGIDVDFHYYQDLPYTQPFEGFELNLAAIDRLFCTGGVD